MTPHINAKENAFAKTVLMPGDPLRAKFIAENYLENVSLVTDVRNMYGYTGEYKGKKISVMGSGMGIPSISIYAYELFNFYGVENIIRVGSCGAYSDKLDLYDIVLAQGACTNSSFQENYHIPGTFSAIADFDLLLKAYNNAKDLGIEPHVGNVLSSDVFYQDDVNAWKKWQSMDVLAVEMESYALYTIAANLGKKALTILTVSDSLVTQKETTAEERQNSFTKMMEIALNL
ncbi:purine-nucleoside phosphorylase [Peptoniphilus asaccharolyticus DSM 20463]|uniref:Purine nucleoside phosphorylase DeoD-type n=1 Tax=Peptoniphilus asaccharolyticus DSM 20463 TaxID=573058 RepID=A0A1W1UKQ7_PEPAS|nr:purine-nucleoside phosphorylase [Peptoniphilus asaccharolyticus]MBL7574854.1 purine-nucleoside phosphorylase [Peptoniphilus asaccharolyticus]SMB81708.1 purine-nucleoside phosphorylase [Peptoniphilus asaccharolyticus DSM 20463]